MKNVGSPTLFSMNQTITLFFNSFVGHSHLLDGFIYFCAQILPWVVALLFIVIIIFSFKQTIKPFIFSLVTLFFVYFSAGFFKYLFDSQRPFQILDSINPLFVHTGFGSIPSGHAMFFASLVTLVFFFRLKFSHFFLFGAFLIGISRIVAGVHFFGDIIIGFVFGFILTYIAIKLFKKHIKIVNQSSIFSR